jgi:hypothetical protein
MIMHLLLSLYGALALPPPPAKTVDADMKRYNNNPPSSAEDKFRAL